MLYTVVLQYVRPIAEIDAHLETHKAWLVQHTRAGRIITAGPLEPRVGGLLIVACKSRMELDAMLAEDSYAINKLAEYEVRAFAPTLRAGAFPAEWAPDAKAV